MGRIRAVERTMLGRAQFDRMIEAKTADDALRVLSEAGYGAGGDTGGSGGLVGASGSVGAPGSSGSPDVASDYERLLDEENGKLIAFILEVSPARGLLGVFLRRYDYHNIKALLKAEFSGLAGDPPLSGMGLVSPEKLALILRERSFSQLTPAMAAGAEDAILAYGKSQDPQAIDVRLDHAMYAEMLADAAALENPFLVRLVRIYIDLANITAFLRMRAMKKGSDFLRETLIPGGEVDRGLFYRHFSDGLETFIAAMLYTPYGQVCEEGLKNYQSTGRLTAFERGADDYVNGYIKAARLRPVGAEVIVCYFVARQAELKNVRIVMVGKKNGISGDVIRERLRETYV
jgi:V/A-type H+-transporting ATPase subunit C